MMIFDSHTHIHFPLYDNDREEVIARAKKADVKMICVGTQAETSESAIELAKKYSQDIWATVGYHPNHLSDDWYHDKKEQLGKNPEEFKIDNLRKLAENEKVVAIGECGLDYFRVTSDKRQETRDRQMKVFLEQANLARELNKALMIHCRPSKGTDDAYKDLVELLNPIPQTLNPIVHFYVGSLDMTKKLVDMGFYFTFGGVITFARDYDESIKYIPLDRILFETDAPYVAPLSERGKRNEPAFILETAKKMAEIKGLEYDKILEITTENAQEIFKI
jgi:TatD DNase family protein